VECLPKPERKSTVYRFCISSAPTYASFVNIGLAPWGSFSIGAHSASTFPPEAAELPRFDYQGDPESIIAANPDLVLIRSFISKNVPDFVAALEKAGIPVVPLYPEKLEQFDDYIQNRTDLPIIKGAIILIACAINMRKYGAKKYEPSNWSGQRRMKTLPAPFFSPAPRWLSRKVAVC